jgi:hypothetical protein
VPIYFRFESDDETLLVNALQFSCCEEIDVLGGVSATLAAVRQTVQA